MALSTIFMIIYFSLIFLSSLGIFAVPALVLGSVALVVAVALAVRR